MIIQDEKRRTEILGMLETAYWMELETVMNYIANSVNLDGVRAEEIKKSLAADVTAEIGHGQQFASVSRRCRAQCRAATGSAPRRRHASRLRTRLMWSA